MLKSDEVKLIGIDLGGTNINIGLVVENTIIDKDCVKIPDSIEDKWDVIHLIVDLIKKFLDKYANVNGIGIGVPSILDREKGIIHEMQNIPSWEEVPLTDILVEEFGIPVFLDNDANCFALGEYQYGAGKGYKNIAGVTLGTGLGVGIISNGHLIGDANGGAGEFGMIPYKNGILEDYCSGKFFRKFYNQDGETLMQLAIEGNDKAKEAFKVFGEHLGNAISIIMYAIDPECIVIGGSIVNSSKYFDASLRENVNIFAYKKTLEKIEIIYSSISEIAVLGAAFLYYDRVTFRD